MANTKIVLLDQIKADIIENNICPDLATQAMNLVMGDGDIDADIVLIGEAPGKNEDEQGLPFVGAAGKFLDEMLAEAGLNRTDVYITNIVKYRPPKIVIHYQKRRPLFGHIWCVSWTSLTHRLS